MSFELPIEENPDSFEKELEKTYELESGIKIDVGWEEFEPELETEDATRAEIVLPGWGMESSHGAIKKLSKEYANSSNSKTFAIHSRAEQPSSEDDTIDILYEEAKAIASFIKEQGIEKITLTGHSQGGDKAINIASILQNDPNVDLQGITLLGSVGLYDQDSQELVKGFAKDTLISTPASITKNMIEEPENIPTGLKALGQMIGTISKEMLASGKGYFDRFNREISEMSEQNPRLSEIKVPTVIISGAHDPVSDKERIVPENIEEELKEACDLPTCDIREHYLKENLLPNSPYVRLLAPSKLGHHALPVFRPESVAKVSTYLHERYARESDS